MQPVVHATTRTPGPSTVEPVVNECRKPMSPLSSALCTSISGTSLPKFTRISNGLFAVSDRGSDGGVGFRSGIAGGADCGADFGDFTVFGDGDFTGFADFADFAPFAALPGFADFDRLAFFATFLA